MTEHFYTTDEIVSDTPADVWREFISETFVELDCSGMSKEQFFGELRARSLGPLGISTITTDAYDVYRTKSGIAKSKNDDFLISIQSKGSSVIRQLGREAVLNPGDFTIYDSAIPYHLHFANRLSQIVIQIPRELMKEHLSVPEALTAVPIRGDGGIAQITTKFASTAFKQSLDLADANKDQVVRTFLELLSTSMRESANTPVRTRANRATQLIRVKQYIADRLKDPSLSPKGIAAAHSITVRYLQILFESENASPNKYIWNQRLIRARQDLQNPSMKHKSISEICFTWAFSDTAHFSRAFKAKFEMSPRAFRNKSLPKDP